VPSLAIVVSAVLVLSRGQTDIQIHRHTDTQTHTQTDADERFAPFTPSIYAATLRRYML